MRTLLMLVLLMSLPVMADIYRWVDAEGNVHYGDRPSETDDAEALEVQERSVDTDIGEHRQEFREKLLDVMQEDRQAKQEERRRLEAERRERASKCAAIKARYQKVKHATGVYRKGKDGERSYYSKEKRQDYEAKHRKLIRKYCS